MGLQGTSSGHLPRAHLTMTIGINIATATARRASTQGQVSILMLTSPTRLPIPSGSAASTATGPYLIQTTPFSTPPCSLVPTNSTEETPALAGAKARQSGRWFTFSLSQRRAGGAADRDVSQFEAVQVNDSHDADVIRASNLRCHFLCFGSEC